MFTALILACSLNYEECKAFSSGTAFLEEEACLMDVAIGIASIESGGWIVMDWTCHNWGQSI